ncbi:MAG: beta-hexosaminidase, partial [Thomasclavelia sp.]
NYSVASYTSLVETLNAVKMIYEDPNTTVEEVMNAQNALIKAIAGLEVNPSNLPVDNNPGNNVKSGDTTVNATKTGDNSLVGIFTELIIVSIVGLTMYRKKVD